MLSQQKGLRDSSLSQLSFLYWCWWNLKLPKNSLTYQTICSLSGSNKALTVPGTHCHAFSSFTLQRLYFCLLQMSQNLALGEHPGFWRPGRCSKLHVHLSLWKGSTTHPIHIDWTNQEKTNQEKAIKNISPAAVLACGIRNQNPKNLFSIGC